MKNRLTTILLILVTQLSFGQIVASFEGNPQGFKDVSAYQDYDYIGYSSEGFTLVWLNGKAGLIDKIGYEVVPPKYDCLKGLRDGLVIVCNGQGGHLAVCGDPCAEIIQGKYGVIDTLGKEIVPLIYDGISYFNDEGLARVKLNEKYGVIDKTGKVIVPIIYDLKTLPKYRNSKYYIDGIEVEITR